MCALVCWLTSRINILTAQHWALCVHHHILASSPDDEQLLCFYSFVTQISVDAAMNVHLCAHEYMHRDFLALSLLNIARWLSKQLPKLVFSNTCMHTHKHTSIHTCTHVHTHEYIHIYSQTYVLCIIKAQVSYTFIYYPFHIFTVNLLFVQWFWWLENVKLEK